MTGYDPSTLRSLARRYAASPGGGFSGFGILAYSGALNAAVRWAEREQSYLSVARSIGVTETDARTVLDEVAAERHARWLDVNCDDTFREARSRLHSGAFDRDAKAICEYLTETLLPADLRAAGIRFEWAEQR
ncbi:hypothetical protein ACFZB5_13545 [Streptomyces nodosus]|uniref:hypothetical protein n=1 Tax=Streptomyces nodosus TaxID=40318 RepID=UPI0036E833A8